MGHNLILEPNRDKCSVNCYFFTIYFLVWFCAKIPISNLIGYYYPSTTLLLMVSYFSLTRTNRGSTNKFYHYPTLGYVL
nr:MAG TPA: hypothetical protein [Bacteriophage sp.]